ncbi:MAG TPA: glycosyltransferase family 2 protein [Polyangiales bacterium]|nr:glycosyltransferase family 2 protein [Polyangiales bacterium]
MRLCVIIVNYRTPGLVLDALESLAGQLEVGQDQVVIVDNGSGDDSAARIEQAIGARGFSRICRVIRSPRNLGFSAGNNLAIRTIDAQYYLLLNSDTIVRERAIATLLNEMDHHLGVGIGGPRLESLAGKAQVSCFRDYSPMSEFLIASDSESPHRWFEPFDIALPISDEPIEPDWISFACAIIRHDVIDKIGLLDEGYFMFFEDSDYCRAARAAGFRIRYFPKARVVHLLGGTAPDVKTLPPSSGRAPRYFYQSRARYFRKGYGVAGVVAANALWQLGRSVSFGRELIGRKAPHASKKEWLDNWTDTFKLQR